MKFKVYIILDNIRSRENVGSIFRTADAAGVGKIYLCGITPTPKIMEHGTWNMNQKTGFRFQDSSDKIHKTALGAETYVPWEYCRETWRLIAKLKKEGINIVALEQTKESVNIFSAEGGSASGGKFKPKFPLALVLGNEVRGLSPQILKYCGKKISIPMYGKKESLNVSVAAGVAIYQIKHS